MREARLRWLGIAALACFACGSVEGDTRPNFLILIADDQAAGTLGGAGDPFARTPRLDELAADGIRFSNSFVTTSLCSPARASFLTGQYVRRHGVADNFTPLPRDVPTYASLLRDAGYETAYVGKWHLGGRAEARPGFEWTASFAGQGEYTDCYFYVGDALRATTGHVDDVSTGFAIEFLRRRRTAPFLLVVGFKGLHVPRTPPPRFEGMFEDVAFEPPANLAALAPYPRRDEYAALKGERAEDDAASGFDVLESWAGELDRAVYDVAESQVRRGARKYYRSLAAVDGMVGRLLDTLDELGRREDTVVVYLSDNGTLRYAHGMVGKRAAYEESMRVETLVRYPNGDRSSRTRDELILNVDLAPALLDIAGVPIPAAMQGRSWRPLLDGDAKAAAGWREAVVYEYYAGRFPFVPTMFALRTHTAKLIEYPGYAGWTEHFDLTRDPGEAHNVAADPGRAGQRDSMLEQLARLERELGARLP